jgi:dihydroxy-acid dehydratase
MTERLAGFEHGLTNYGDRDFSLYLRRSFAQSMGYSREMLGKPVVGIAYTGSGFNNCHRHFPELLEAVKRGVLAAGALPVEFPTISLGEVFLSPTSLKYRNLMSIDTEEMIRAQPWTRSCSWVAATRPCRRSSWGRSPPAGRPSCWWRAR